MNYNIIEANLLTRKQEMSDIIEYSDLTNLEKLELATKYKVWKLYTTDTYCFKEEEKLYEAKCIAYGDKGRFHNVYELLTCDWETNHFIDVVKHIKELSETEEKGSYWLNEEGEFLFLESGGDNTPPVYMPTDWIIEKIAEYCVKNKVIGF